MFPIKPLTASLGPLALLAACSGGPQAPTNDTDPAATNATANAAANDLSPEDAAAVRISNHDDLLAFDYGWSGAADAIPALAQWLRGHGERARAQALDAAGSDRAAAQEAGFPFRQNSFSQIWSTVADTPDVLILQAAGYTFTGGAHGMPFVASLIWDKRTEKRRGTGALIDIPTLVRAEHDRFCAALDAQRAAKRPPQDDDTDMPDFFTQCVDMAEQDIIPISTGGAALDTIRVVILPYEAGPYSEGIYTIELPLDAAAIAAVKPDWRDAFTLP